MFWQCNRNYMFIHQVALARREKRFLVIESNCLLPTCLVEVSHCLSFLAKSQAEKLGIPIFIVFGLTRVEIEPESTISVSDNLPNQPS